MAIVSVYLIQTICRIGVQRGFGRKSSSPFEVKEDLLFFKRIFVKLVAGMCHVGQARTITLISTGSTKGRWRPMSMCSMRRMC